MPTVALRARSPERSTTTPLVVLVAVLAWYAAASTVLVAALAAERVEASTGVLLGVATAGDVTSPTGVGGVVLGIALLLGCALLGLGHGWALRALVPLGGLAVVAFAATGSWLTLVLMACLLVGTAPLLLSGRAVDHLRGRR